MARVTEENEELEKAIEELSQSSVSPHLTISSISLSLSLSPTLQIPVLMAKKEENDKKL